MILTCEMLVNMKNNGRIKRRGTKLRMKRKKRKLKE